MPNRLLVRIKIASLVITQIEMASAYSPQLIQEQFLPVPLRNAAMERTASVDTIKEHVHIMVELQNGWNDEVSFFGFATKQIAEVLFKTLSKCFADLRGSYGKVQSFETSNLKCVYANYKT